jgi:UrcA family protein
MSKLFNAETLGGLVLAATVLVAGAAPALAHAADGQTSVTISYRDLDVSHSAGAKALYQRISAASVRACGGAPDLRRLDEVAAFDQCRASAIRQAIASVDAPTLSDMAAQDLRNVRMASR